MSLGIAFYAAHLFSKMHSILVHRCTLYCTLCHVLNGVLVYATKPAW